VFFSTTVLYLSIRLLVVASLIVKQCNIVISTPFDRLWPLIPQYIRRA